MRKHVFWAAIIVACIFIFASVPAKAAYEFYVIKLEGFGQDKHKDWSQVNNIVRSVKGVKSVKIDRNKNQIRISCGSHGCNDNIVDKVKSKLTRNRYVVSPSSVGGPQVGTGKIAGTRGK